eukprot:m.235420 g.235420  ORF g.235420 m.235420 type:complete len:58 (-) comp18926_c0_seq2:3196-3369(-)
MSLARLDEITEGKEGKQSKAQHNKMTNTPTGENKHRPSYKQASKCYWTTTAPPPPVT